MSGIEGIREVNSGNALHKRARAYCLNNPGVGFAEACAILTKKDAKATKVYKSLRKARG